MQAFAEQLLGSREGSEVHFIIRVNTQILKRLQMSSCVDLANIIHNKYQLDIGWDCIMATRDLQKHKELC